MQKKLKGKTGKVAQALLCLLGVCLWCFEKILRYVNRQAYVEVNDASCFILLPESSCLLICKCVSFNMYFDYDDSFIFRLLSMGMTSVLPRVMWSNSYSGTF